jgi:predicted benzoate:H+ symporter BenE
VVKDIPALIMFVLGASGVTFCGLQGGWWLLGLLPAGALCVLAGMREIRAQDRARGAGS